MDFKINKKNLAKHWLEKSCDQWPKELTDLLDKIFTMEKSIADRFFNGKDKVELDNVIEKENNIKFQTELNACRAVIHRKGLNKHFEKYKEYKIVEQIKKNIVDLPIDHLYLRKAKTIVNCLRLWDFYHRIAYEIENTFKEQNCRDKWESIEILEDYNPLDSRKEHNFDIDSKKL